MKKIGGKMWVVTFIRLLLLKQEVKSTTWQHFLLSQLNFNPKEMSIIKTFDLEHTEYYQSLNYSPNQNRLYFMKPWIWRWLGPHLHTVEFSRNLEALRKVPVILTFLSHWFLTWLSWLGSLSRTPIHLVSRLRARLFLWWSSLSSLWRILSSVSSSLK